jgi:hypothetical protein
MPVNEDGGCSDPSCIDCYGSIEVDDWEDDDEYGSGLVADYHCADRSHWTTALRSIRAAGGVAIGVELEVACRNGSTQRDVARRVLDENGFIVEHDSSLPEYGVELIGPPQDLTKVGTDEDPWVKVCTDIQRLGARGWHYSQCGMHVTVDRHNLSRQQLALLVYAINTWHHIPSMAGRDSDQWARRDTAMSYERAFELVQRGSDRYRAANVKSNMEAIELRIFRSNVKDTGFVRVMSWLRELIEFIQSFEGASNDGRNFDATTFDEADFLLRTMEEDVPEGPEEPLDLAEELEQVLSEIELTKVQVESADELLTKATILRNQVVRAVPTIRDVHYHQAARVEELVRKAVYYPTSKRDFHRKVRAAREEAEILKVYHTDLSAANEWAEVAEYERDTKSRVYEAASRRLREYEAEARRVRQQIENEVRESKKKYVIDLFDRVYRSGDNANEEQRVA